MNDKKWESYDVVRALDRHFSMDKYEIGNEWRAFTEVQGLDGRRIDYLAMGMWPSRGFKLIAYEIKVTKEDLKRELSVAGKSDGWWHLVDEFWLATPPGLSEGFDVPDTWGICEIPTKRANARSMDVVRKAPKAGRKGKSIPQEVIARIIQRMYETNNTQLRDAVWKAQQEEREKPRMTGITPGQQQKLALFDEIEKLLGCKVLDYFNKWGAMNPGPKEAVQMMQWLADAQDWERDTQRLYNDTKNLQATAKRLADRTAPFVAELSVRTSA
jgi:hypothetical protein